MIRSRINLKAYFNETAPGALRQGEAEMGPMQVSIIHVHRECLGVRTLCLTQPFLTLITCLYLRFE